MGDNTSCGCGYLLNSMNIISNHIIHIHIYTSQCMKNYTFYGFSIILLGLFLERDNSTFSGLYYLY